jgi:NADPH2:quinone reductase
VEAAAPSQAIVMRDYGPPTVLALEPMQLPALGPSELRIRTIAAAINHSDLEIRAGHWPIRRPHPFAYVPGLEAVGEVVEAGPAVHAVHVGDRVVTMMQGLGGVRAERPGGYAEHVTVAADAVASLATEVDPYDAAALGLGAVTAHQGLASLGELDGRRIVVTGAAGGVGSNAVAIAAARGAEVIGVVRDDGAAAYVRSLGAAAVVSDVSTLAARSADGVLDVVGGHLFERLVACLASGGRYSVVGAMAGDRVSFSLWELVRGVTLAGYSSEALDGAGLRSATEEIFALYLTGRLRAPEWRTMPLSRAADAHALLEHGGVSGRVLLVPAEP